jgi:hypothetical protein
MVLGRNLGRSSRSSACAGRTAECSVGQPLGVEVPVVLASVGRERAHPAAIPTVPSRREAGTGLTTI